MRSSEHERVGQLVTMTIVGFPSANEQRDSGVVDLLDGVSQSVLSVASNLRLVFRQDLNPPPFFGYSFNQISYSLQSAWMA